MKKYSFLIFILVLLVAELKAFATDVFHRMDLPIDGGYLVVAEETHDYLIEQFGQWRVCGLYEIPKDHFVEWALHSAVRSNDSVTVELRLRRPGGESSRLVTKFTFVGVDGPIDDVVVANSSPSRMNLTFGDPRKYNGKLFSFFVYETLDQAKEAIRVVSFQPGWTWRSKLLP